MSALGLPASAQSPDPPTPPAEADAPPPPSAEVAEATLPAHPDVDAARNAYNAERYQDAARRFLKLAQRWPENAALYLALARARFWAKDDAGAVIAYRLYLEVFPTAPDKDKVTAELDLALRRLPSPPPNGRPSGPARLLAAAPIRAQAGRFAGEDGAFGAIEEALAAGFLGPEITATRATVEGALRERTGAAIEAWWAPTTVTRPATLERLQAGWSALGAQRPLNELERASTEAIEGLTRLQSAPAEAVEILAPVAGTDPRLRYAQAVALLNADRAGEAAAALAAARDHLDDPRIDLLRGVALLRAGDSEGAADALAAGLAR